MAKKKVAADTQIEEIKKYVKDGKAIIGTERTIKAIKQGMAAKVFITSNTPEAVKSDIEHYAKIAQVPVLKLSIPNDELGVVCKKQHSISVMSYIKV